MSEKKNIDITAEVWKDIAGYEGLYQVSNMGRVKSLNKVVRRKNSAYCQPGRILKPAILKNGYCVVSLSNRGIHKMAYVHKLVAETFLLNPDRLPEVNYKDENKSHNFAYNLEWCTKRYNLEYGTARRRAAQTKINGKLSRSVMQYTLSGELVAEYPSLSEVSRQRGFAESNISTACSGIKEQAYGYKWRYKEDMKEAS